MARGRPRKNPVENSPEVEQEVQLELPAESEASEVPELPQSEVNMDKIPSKYHKFQKGV